MKFQLYIFICLFFYLSKCEELLIPTNYTLSYFNNIDMTKMTCQTDKDCPEFSTCGSFKSKESKKTLNVCRFGNFLCQEKRGGYFSQENDNCIYVNTKMWDMDEQEMNKGFDKKLKPILKTCPNIVKSKKHDDDDDDDDDIDCDTEKCTKNEDCISGLCIDDSCRSNINMYRCSGEGDGSDDEEYLKCGKDAGMACEDDEDCFSGACDNNFCLAKKPSKLRYLLYGIGGIVMLAIVVVFGSYSEKNEDKN
ncbi:hypothetical protein BCR32DRAFT_272870 [Anaeromyces robustus]|uniref:Uncharacterized protein n=1 Tax=Anaeromyces robustus TaxID=1754192 RepID=A0A1Y1VUR4_9FUNG|nr:hypothetical protein BCR32DRAFT_272870 [Anaeromyces robustus]|eukprot:ORX65030.1 hypothetical protein BCR32DRAFT_272870 [Anaeromyces robustus]